MADRDINVNLNIPSFMEGRAHLPAAEVLEGHKIASVRIPRIKKTSRIAFQSLC